MRKCQICGNKIELSKEMKEDIDEGYYEYPKLCDECYVDDAGFFEDFEYMQYSDADSGL